MPATIGHVLSATTPDDPSFEIQPQHWNSNHAVTLDISATEISGLFSNANGVSFGTTDGKITATVKTDYLTTAALSNHSHGNPTLALTNLSGTTDSNSAGFTLSLSAAAPGAGGAVNFSAGTTSGDLDAVVFSNSNGLAFGLDGSTITGSYTQSTHAHSEYVFSNSNGVSFGTNGSTVTATVKTDYLTTAALSNHSHGNPTLALTSLSGTTASNSAGFTLSLAAGAYITTAALSNHSHGNPTLALTNLSGTTDSNSAGFTLSLSAANPGGGADKTISFIEIMDGARITTCGLWNNATYSRRPIFVPFQAEHVLDSCRSFRIMASRTGGTSLLGTIFAGVYSRANSTSMNLISSTSNAFSLTTSALFSGVRIYDITGLSDLSLSPGGYVLGLLASIPATVSWGLNFMGGDGVNIVGHVLVGTNSTAATHSQSHLLPFWGVFNATTGGLPAAVASASISGGHSVNSPDLYAVIKAI